MPKCTKKNSCEKQPNGTNINKYNTNTNVNGKTKLLRK